jgi:hypothetical protein
VAAATALNAPLGSIYAFSVFLKPLEALLGLSRADLAFVFALAAAVFAAGMNLVPLAFGRVSAPVLALACAGLAALGIVLVATAGGLRQLALGYGVRAALGWFAVVLALLGLVGAWLTARSGVVLTAASAGARMSEDDRRRPVFWRLWFIFFLAASAGLMVLSQAAGIITAYGGAAGLAVYGTMFITATVAAARLIGGWMTDWLAIPGVAAGAHAVALAGGVALTLWPGARMSVLALGLVGLGYGLISGVTAAAIAVYWRRALYGRVASRIYIAWSAAAVVLPIIAGRLFDLTQGYGAAVMIAAGGNVLGIVVALGLPRPER